MFPGAVRLARELHPDLPIVGYERGDSLVAAESEGFEPLQRLTVWNRSAVCLVVQSDCRYVGTGGRLFGHS